MPIFSNIVALLSSASPLRNLKAGSHSRRSRPLPTETLHALLKCHREKCAAFSSLVAARGTVVTSEESMCSPSP